MMNVLHFAASNNKLNVIKTIIENIDTSLAETLLRSKDFNGRLPLHFAAENVYFLFSNHKKKLFLFFSNFDKKNRPHRNFFDIY